MKVLKKSKPRSEEFENKLNWVVSSIIEDIREQGDAALLAYSKQFDESKRDTFKVSTGEIASAYDQVSPEEVEDMKAAAANIETFARAQRETLSDLSGVAPAPGMDLGHRIIPIGAACCYVPGGNYPLYSTALMLGVPAKVAGVQRICGCSPVMKGTGSINPKTLVAMDIAGMDEIYALGGAQAIAAFAYGTDSIKPVNIIVGPGNPFVTEAKKQCYGKVGIDFVAGPSEVLVIADKTADPDIVAADLLAQSEHDFMAKGIVITLDEGLGKKIIEAVEEQLKTLDTANIACQSWEDYGEVLLAGDIDEAIAYVNEYAPEHLELNLAKDNEDHAIEKLTNYGSLFIGQNTAEVFGDYASGTNHTLPTLGAAKYTGGVYVGTFLKTCTYQRMTKEASAKLAPLVERLAKGEGLSAHATAARIRQGEESN